LGLNSLATPKSAKGGELLGVNTEGGDCASERREGECGCTGYFGDPTNGSVIYY